MFGWIIDIKVIILVLDNTSLGWFSIISNERKWKSYHVALRSHVNYCVNLFSLLKRDSSLKIFSKLIVNNISLRIRCMIALN